MYLVMMEGIALYYQYVLQFFPCALCVQVRAGVGGAIVSAGVSAYFKATFWIRFVGLSATIFFMSGALYTSWNAWGVENGTVISSCTIGAGFPTFMPLDQWIPFFFGADGPCGQSPEMWLGLSMVETLLITIGVPLIVLIAQWLMHIPHAIVSTIRFATS